MPEASAPSQRARRRLHRLLASAIVATLVIGCGGGTPAGSAGGGAGSPAASTGSGGGGGGGGGGATAVGEPYDEAIVLAAADTLAGVDSYVYEATIVQTGGSGTRTQTVHGIVRKSPEARSVSYTAEGDTIVLLHVDGKDYGDYGTGFQAVGPDAGTRESTDPLSIRTLYGAFAGHADDFIVAGRETTHQIPSVHLVLDPDALADRRESLGAGAEGWIAELWLAEADGQLVKAVWGGPQAPPPDAFGQPVFTIDVTDTSCECPVKAPG